MSKVDWITWKTEANEIINPNLIAEKLDGFYENYYTYMKPIIYEQLRSEMLVGGLSKDSFNISGVSPANDQASEIIDKIDNISYTYAKMKDSILQSAVQQKEIEKRQLLDAIQDKITFEEDKIKTLSEQGQSAASSVSISVAYDQLKKLREKLELVQSL